jgi:hypothetical protein
MTTLILTEAAPASPAPQVFPGAYRPGMIPDAAAAQYGAPMIRPGASPVSWGPRRHHRARPRGRKLTTMTTQASTASVTSPGSGATLASVTVPAPGEYEVVASVYFEGTITIATDSDNVEIQSDPVTASTFVVAEVLSQPAVVSQAPVPLRCNLYAQSTVKLTTVAAGTASSVYHVHLEVNPVAVSTIGETT